MFSAFFRWRRGVKVCLLASGSKGNSLYIEAGDTRLVIDAGLAASEIAKRLESIGVDAGSVNALLITHEHGDHVRGAGAFARKFKVPVVISYPTHRTDEKAFRKTEVIEFESGHSFSFRDLLIDPFPITHDAADPVGFIIDSGEGRVGVATDLGIATRLVRDKLKECRVLVLESNHDEEMLVNGPYPWHLKQRIKSRHGHLSNIDSADLLGEVLHQNLEGLFLAHLSEVNNDPAVASSVVRDLLDRRNICAPQMVVGNQYRASHVFSA